MVACSNKRIERTVILMKRKRIVCPVYLEEVPTFWGHKVCGKIQMEQMFYVKLECNRIYVAYFGIAYWLWVVFIIGFHVQATSFCNWVLFSLLGGQDTNRFLTKKGRVARILTFVCRRCLGSTSSRTWLSSHSIFVILLIPSRWLLPYFNNYVIAAISQFLLSSSLLIIQP